MVNKTLTAISDEDVEKIEEASKEIKTIPIKAKKFTIPKPEISIESLPQENERKISIGFKFNAHKFNTDDVEGFVELILERSKDGVISALNDAVNQEQKWLDKTRQ